MAPSEQSETKPTAGNLHQDSGGLINPIIFRTQRSALHQINKQPDHLELQAYHFFNNGKIMDEDHKSKVHGLLLPLINCLLSNESIVITKIPFLKLFVFLNLMIPSQN